MHIEYETTLDEVADTHLCVASRSKLARRTRWRSTLWTAVLTAVLVFLLLSLRAATLGERYVIAGFSAVVGAGVYWFRYPRSMKRRILKYLREQSQTDGPLRFAVELREDCIWTKLGATQLSFEWPNVGEILDSTDGIEFRMRDGGLVFVRGGGFPSQTAREQFKEIANQRMEHASGKSTDNGTLPGAEPP